MRILKFSAVFMMVVALFGCSLIFDPGPSLIVTVNGQSLDLSFSSIEWLNVEIEPRTDLPVEILNTGENTVTVEFFVEDADQPTAGTYQFSVSESSVDIGAGQTASVNLRFDPTLPSYTLACCSTDSRAVVRITDNDDEEFILRMGGVVTLTHKFDIVGTAGPGPFDSPFGIALYAGDVYIADTNNSRVHQFDETGTWESSFGSNGTGNKQFDGVTGLAVSPVGFVTTGETTNGRIQRFTPLDIFDSMTDGLGEVYGVAISSDIFSDIITYVTDSGGLVRMFDEQDGTPLGTFGSAGSGPGQLDTPFAIALDANANIYVTDGGANDKIHVFDSAGTYVTEFTEATLDDPQGIAVFSSGDVYVTDSVNNRIVIFDRNHEYVTEIGSATLDLDTPRGIVIDEGNGNIYIVDAGNNRVRVYRLE